MSADATSTKFCSTTDSSSESEVGCGLTDLSISFCFSDQDFRVFSNTWRKTKNIPEWEKKRERGGEGFGNKLCRSPNREKKRERGGERERKCERNRESTSSWNIQPAEYTYPIPGQHLSSILVDDVDVPRGLHPSFSIHLSWHCLIPHYGDFHTTTLQTKMGFILSNISKGTDTYMYHKISCIQTTIKYKKPSSHIFHTLKCYLTFS